MKLITYLLFFFASLRMNSAQSLYYVGDEAQDTLPLKWTTGINVVYDINVVPRAKKQQGDFSLFLPKQVTITSNPPATFDSFRWAEENEVINQEIDWASYSSMSGNHSITVDNISVVGGNGSTRPWQNSPQKDQATFIRIPEVPWITGKEQLIEIPIETDGEINVSNGYLHASFQAEIVQEWTTDITKLNLAGEDYDVYAKVIPSDSEITEVAVDSQKRVFLPVYYTSGGQQRANYYRIDTQGLGDNLSDTEMPPVITHQFPGKIVETTQRLVSTKCRLKVSANQSQNILLHRFYLYVGRQRAISNAEVIISTLYQMGDVASHHVAVDQIGDVLPTTGEIVFWRPSMAGSYIGTLVSGQEYGRAPIGNGVVRSLLINKHGIYSGVIQARGFPPLRIRGKFSATEATSISAEVVDGIATERGCRLAFMRMANGSFSIVAKCYFGGSNQFHCLAEKVLPKQKSLPKSHTLVMPVDQNAYGIGADATGIMTISSHSSVKFLMRFPGGKTIAQSTRITANGMVPLFFDQHQISLVGRLRYTPKRELGDWTGGLSYLEEGEDSGVILLSGVCVGHPFLGWKKAASSVTIHLEDENGVMTRLAGSYKNGKVFAEGLEIKLLPNGSLRGHFLTANRLKYPIMGVALSSQDIWTCHGNLNGMKKITVTGNLQQ